MGAVYVLILMEDDVLGNAILDKILGISHGANELGVKVRISSSPC